MAGCTSKYVRLDEIQKSKIIRLHRQEELSMTQLAKRFGVSWQTIQNVLKGEETDDIQRV